jgi:hypothetical protein
MRPARTVRFVRGLKCHPAHSFSRGRA